MARAPRTSRTNRRRVAGFTLLEALIAAVVLAIGVVGVSATLTASTQQSKAMATDTTAQMLARELMEEVAAKPFNPPNAGDQPGAQQGNTHRETYDNLADYNGYQDATPLKSLAGDVIDTGDGVTYFRTVGVEFRNTPSGGPVSLGDFAMVTVTVKANGGRTISINRLVTNVNLIR